MEDTAQLTDKTLALLEKLVAFDSVSHKSNLPVIDFIEDYLEGCGVTAVRIPSPDGTKCNLLARIGAEAPGGVVLSGHSDVVPVEGQRWSSDPFILTRREDKWFGRGASDMKCFIATCLAFAPSWARLDLKKPIWLAFSYDEEVGCLGVPHLLEYVSHHVPKPAFALIGEPTLMEVVTAHKGVLSFETTVYGLEHHSSQPHLGVNAVHIACDLVHFLHGMTSELSKTGLKDVRFDPPYSTVHVGTIHGGTARNIIAKECKILWEIRPLPGENVDALLTKFEAYCDTLRKHMKQTHADTDIVTQPLSAMHGVTLPDNAEDAAQLVMRCAQKNTEQAVSFGTEAGVFNHYGIPAIICGPGSIEQAHKPDEWIAHTQVEAGVNFMLRFTKELA